MRIRPVNYVILLLLSLALLLMSGCYVAIEQMDVITDALADHSKPAPVQTPMNSSGDEVAGDGVAAENGLALQARGVITAQTILQMYPVQELLVYADYDAAIFKEEQAPEGEPQTPGSVVLAITEIERGEGEHHLYATEPITEGVVSFETWQLYSTFTREDGANEGGDIALGPAAAIVTTTVIAPNPTAGTVFISLTDIESRGFNSNNVRAILFRDMSDETPVYKLAIFQGEDSGAPGDRVRAWLSRCRARWCRF